eukprot:2456214-Ditylum_brightwellii.AAC.1
MMVIDMQSQWDLANSHVLFMIFLGQRNVCISANCEVRPTYVAVVLDELLIVVPGHCGQGGCTGHRKTAIDILCNKYLGIDIKAGVYLTTWFPVDQ